MIKYDKHKGIRMREWFEDSWWVAFAFLASIIISIIFVLNQKTLIMMLRYSHQNLLSYH